MVAGLGFAFRGVDEKSEAVVGACAELEILLVGLDDPFAVEDAGTDVEVVRVEETALAEVGVVFAGAASVEV